MGRSSKEQKQFREQLLKTVLKCKDSPAMFARDILGYEPYWYNAPYLDCMEKWVVYRNGRQAGKSQSVACKALHFAWYAPYLLDTVHDTCEILMVAPTKNQATIVMDKIKAYIKRNKILKSYVVKEIANEIWIRFVNGAGITKIYTRASGDKGDTIRGYSPHVIIIDEAAFVRNAVITALLPAGLATNARVWMCSTPLAKQEYFFEACNNARAGSEILKNTIWDKPEGKWIQFKATSLMSPDVKKHPDMVDELNRLSRDAHQVEVLGEFLDAGNSLIPHSLLVDAVGDFDLPDNITYYLGVDIARHGKDETVYTLIAVDRQGKVYMVDSQTKASTPITEVVDDIEEYFKIYGRKLETAFLDETGVGGGALDFALARNLPVRGLQFGTQSKSELYVNLLKIFERRNIKLGNSQTELVTQLSYLKKEYTRDGKLRIVSEIDDDRPDSLALACSPLQEGDAWHLLNVKGIEIFQ